MVRSRSIIILVMLALVLPVLNAVQEKFNFSSQEITLEFDNIKVKDIDFYKGDQVIVKYGKKDDLNIEQIDNILSFSGKYETRIYLKLPISKSYKFTKDDAVCSFDSEILEINTGDEIVRFTQDKLEVIEGDRTKIEIGERGIIVDDDDEYVEISREGILVEGDDNTQLTGFWGKMLGSVIQSIARTAISFAGKRPEKIAKYVINDEEDNNAYTYNLGIDLDENNLTTHVFEERYYPQVNSKLTLHNINGSVTINSSDKDFLDVKITKKTKLDDDELDKVEIIIKEGNDFSVTTEHLKRNPKVTVTYEINVPEFMELSKLVTSNGAIILEGTAGEANILTSNGRISIKDHEGNLILRTSNGAIDVADIDGKVNGSTSNGRIELDNISGEVIANTSNGSIEIMRCPVLSKVNTSNARIELEILELQSDLDVVTSNGSINLYISANVDADIEASTNNGKIKTNHPRLNTDRVSKNYMNGKLGKGGFKLNIQTSNSYINLENLEELF